MPQENAPKKIICADDDSVLRKLYANRLAQAGYLVRTCTDGGEAVQAFEEESADLVVLDVSMTPVSGLEACEKLRKQASSFGVPIILVSSAGSEDAIVQGLSYGADDYILKPVRFEELLAKMTMALHKKKSTAARDLGLSVGSLFAGKYEIIDSIGQGGSSRVYFAHDLTTEPATDVAVKLYDLPPSMNEDPNFQARFLREAYGHSRLDHPNIVRFHDFGHAGGYYYLAMEHIDGCSLKEAVNICGPLSVTRLLDVARGMFSALAYLNSHNLIHRDIKPDNIMYTGDTYKLLDFGLARGREDVTLSTGGEFCCTPAYASPECIEGDDVDIRSDMYSLALTLHFAATGTQPITGASAMDTLHNQLDQKPEDLGVLRPDLPPPFSKLIMGILAKSRDQRPSLDGVQAMLNGFI